ncbi:class F sortase [Pseudonocardia sediminis]|nr:class F sortase [Pseudonocardia sediminis]
MLRRGRPGRGVPGALALVLALLMVTGCAAAVAPAAPVPAGPGAAGPGDRPVAVSLRIDAIGVEEPELLRLGVADDGTAEVPEDYARVGRFDNGATLDRSRATVLLGHVDSRSGPAVFYRLRDLRAGDAIEVGLSDGTTARYAVGRSEQVPKDRFPTFAVFGASPQDVLRLVTCAGEFDRGARSYTDNLVVHATRI